jgi:ABC-type antimicrobial peptide transport system permease subunit
MALGADRHAVLGLVLRGGLQMAAVGVAAGAVLAMILARLAGNLLFAVSPYDPTTYVFLAALLLAFAVAAAYLPARRATAMNPLETLR